MGLEVVVLRSMTGYGWEQIELEGMRCTIEIRSINHRFWDVAIRAPKIIQSLEEEIKKWIAQEIHRGKVEVTITFSSGQWPNKKINVDWTLADTYYRALNALKERFNLAGEIGLKEMLSFPDLFVVEEWVSPDSLIAPLKEGVQKALSQLVAMRQREGEALARDLNGRINIIKKSITEIESLAQGVKEYYGERLRERIESFLANRVPVDEGRLLNEVAILAEKADISEECTRIKSHCQQFQLFLESKEPVGRKLEFLIQELHREINTIGAKAHAVEISQLVIQVKSELEKMREQVQNVE